MVVSGISRAIWAKIVDIHGSIYPNFNLNSWSCLATFANFFDWNVMCSFMPDNSPSLIRIAHHLTRKPQRSKLVNQIKSNGSITIDGYAITPLRGVTTIVQLDRGLSSYNIKSKKVNSIETGPDGESNCNNFDNLLFNLISKQFLAMQSRRFAA